MQLWSKLMRCECGASCQSECKQTNRIYQAIDLKHESSVWTAVLERGNTYGKRENSSRTVKRQILISARRRGFIYRVVEWSWVEQLVVLKVRFNFHANWKLLHCPTHFYVFASHFGFHQWSFQSKLSISKFTS